MRKVTIHGPNLRDQNKGTFVVHAAECSDNTHVAHLFDGMTVQSGEQPWTVEVETVEDAVEALYGPDEFEYDPATEMGQFRDDMHFAPCLNDLPHREGS